MIIPSWFLPLSCNCEICCFLGVGSGAMRRRAGFRLLSGAPCIPIVMSPTIDTHRRLLDDVLIETAQFSIIRLEFHGDLY